MADLPSATEIRASLLRDRAETAGRITALAADVADVRAVGADAAVDDEHDPEGATIAFERERLRALLAQAEAHGAALDAALARLDAGSYGTCIRCGAPIGAERLAALPAVATCIGCAR